MLQIAVLEGAVDAATTVTISDSIAAKVLVTNFLRN